MTSWVESCSGRGGWEQVAGVCVKILRSVVQRCLEQFCITFSHKIRLKWVPAGARRPFNQRPGAQVQPRSEFSSIFYPFWEPGGSLRSPWETLLSSLGRLRGTFGGISEQLYRHFLSDGFLVPLWSRKPSEKLFFGGAQMLLKYSK